MTRRWNGDESKRILAYTIAHHTDTCHLCHHPGANSTDHLIPVATDPTRHNDPTNWRPAHLRPAGHPKGCQHPNCHCPGNTGRLDAPADVTRQVVAELNARDDDDQEPEREW